MTIYSRLIGLLVSILLVGCATVEEQMPVQGAPLEKLEEAPVETKSSFHLIHDALDALASNKLLTALNADADNTLAWIDEMQATVPPSLTPLAEFRARACPTSVKVATADLQDKIKLLQAVIDGISGKAPGITLDGPPELILFFTKLRYGPSSGVDPKAALEQLKHDVFERITAVVDSCRAIIPAKQLEEVLKLANKAGLVGISGGSALPFMGILP